MCTHTASIRSRRWFRPQLIALESRVTPNAFPVSSLLNTGVGTLRQAISDANGSAGLDTITFDPGLNGTITLGSELSIVDSVIIVGNGANLDTIDGANSFRAFNINGVGQIVVSISGLNLTKCNGGASTGGGIFVQDEDLTLDGVSINASTATKGGGVAFAAAGKLTVRNSTVSGNSATGATGGGGAIYLTGAPTVLIENSTISGNTTSSRGGGVCLYFWAAPGTFTLRNSTMVNNSATVQGGGIRATTGATPNLTIQSSIVAKNLNAATPDIQAQVVDASDSLIGVGDTGFTFGTKSNVQSGTAVTPLDPLLNALQNNGGPTATHLPAGNSPVINKGANPAALANDQRGLPRVFNGTADIGAVEINPQNFVVINANDAGAGSLRQALLNANSYVNTTDTVIFDPTFFATAKTITLTTGVIPVTDSVTITGLSTVTVSGNNASRIFDIAANATISSLTLTQGKAVSAYGGAITFSNTILTLDKCTVTGSTTFFGGGAVGSSTGGQLIATDCTFTNNTCSGYGGALDIFGAGAETILTRCTISGNASATTGGGLYAFNYLLIKDSTISGNSTTNGNGTGGGIRTNGYFAAAALRIQNSTIANNTAFKTGGGIAMSGLTGILVVLNSTITGNKASGGEGAGGIAVTSGAGTINLVSTIVSGNTDSSGKARPDMFTANTVNANFCAVGSTAGVTTFNGDATTTALLGQPLSLGTLQNNGGPTQTILPSPASPVVGKGSNPAALANDQRGTGFGRVRGAIDIGAVEATTDFVVLNTNNAGAGSLRQAILDSNAFATLDNVTFDPTFFSTPQTNTLTSGEMAITDSVNIIGPGAALSTVDGNNASRIFNINGPNNPVVNLSGLTLTKGKAAGGGAILLTNSNLSIAACALSSNSSTGPGGAIEVTPAVAANTLNIDNSTLSGNTSANSGGALLIYSGPVLVNIRNSTISGNTSGLNGGGIRAYGAFTGTLTINNSTITQNSLTGSGSGRGIAMGGGTTNIASTIVSQNSGGSATTGDCSGTLNVNFSLIGATDGATIVGANNLTGTNAAPLDAKLAALANNGGPTLTHFPASDSPVINKGSNPGALVNDQRGVGFPRNLGSAPDIGAVETVSFVVTNANDAGAGSLRQVILDANAVPGTDNVTFDPTFFSSAKTITLSTGQINITESVIVTGLGANLITVSGNSASRIFNINPGLSSVSISGLTLTKASTGSFGGAIECSTTTLTLANCVVTGNTSNGGGAGVDTFGSLTVTDCTFSNNTSTGGYGGAIDSRTKLVIQRCTLSGNSAGTTGGAFYGSTYVLIENSTISGNSTAGDGGAARISNTFAAGALVIRNSTIANNTAGTSGGGISLTAFTGTLVTQNSTVVGNKAQGGVGGGGIAIVSGAGTMNLESTIVSGNTDSSGNARPDLFTANTVTANFCAIGSKAGVTTFTGDATTNALLGAALNLGVLANNGGPTQTILPAANSPVLNKGSNPAALANDQRGAPAARSSNGGIDIGAVERQNFVVVNDNDSGAGSLRQAVLDANALTPSTDDISFDPMFFNSSKTITLTTGELALNDAVNINGLGPAIVTVSGNNASRIFNTSLPNPGTAFNVSGLTLTGGKSGGSGGAIFVQDEALSLANCVITGNSAGNEGGGVYLSLAAASLNVQSCTFSNNTTNSDGGGFSAHGASPVTVQDTTFSGNTAGGDGGGFYFFSGGSLLLERCTVSGNKANGTTGGGGFYFFGTPLPAGVVVRNSTITNNTSGLSGGGIVLPSFFGTLTVQNSTIVANTSNGGSGGGGIALTSGTGTISIESSVVSGNINAAAPDIFSGKTVNVKTSAIGSNTGFTLTDLGGNLAFQPFANLLLGPLQNNGGPTQTMQPAVNSPLVNVGSNPAAVANEQRGPGFGRARSGAVDIGAVEAFTNFVVTNNNDAGAGSLRQAVLDANAFVGADIIIFDAVFFATAKTITLTTGQLALNEGVGIVGPGVAMCTVSGNNLSRIFDTSPSPTNEPIVISGLTLTSGNGGAMFIDDENVTVTSCVITNNKSSRGGGIYLNSPNGTLTLQNSTVSNNSSSTSGGGINLYNGGSLLVDGCTISGNTNSGTAGGGGIYFWGSVGAGGLTIRNSTISGNSCTVDDGGGIYLNNFNQTLTIQNCTITNNTAAGKGGGIRNNSNGTISIESSVVSGNTNATAPDISAAGTVNVKTSAIGSSTGFTETDQGGNLPFQPHANLKLGALVSNGGPTLTHMPAVDSPLLNVGSNPAGLTTDQRGFPTTRNSNGGVDIGSVERQSFLVTNINDSGAGSLRQAVLNANGLTPSDDAISFDTAGVFATPQTITLTSGEMLVTDNVTFNGPAARVTVSGNNASRIFNINGAGTFSVTLNNLTLTNANSGGGIGGAFLVQDESLTLNNCTVSNNKAGFGGGIRLEQSGAALTLNNSSVTNNTSLPSGNGGGINTNGTATIVITNSTVANNTAGANAGGMEMFGGGSLTITGSTFSGNKTTAAANGGGMELRGTFSTLLIRNSTISGNSVISGSGGGIAVNGVTGTLTVQNSTITNNSAATNGGGIARTSGANTITAVSAIISGNIAGSSGPDIFTGGTANLTDCLLGSASGITTPVFSGSTAPLLGKAPNLGPLADNGGPTQTHLLLPTSPAIGQGSNPAPALTTDQRGRPRAVGNVDIGALELQSAAKVSSLVIGDGTIQRSTVRQLKVNFDSPIVFVGAPAAAFTLKRQSDMMSVNLAAAVDNSGPATVVTLTFTGGAVDNTSLADGRYTLTVLASQIGAEGLDGDGNGTGGDDYTLIGNPATNKLYRFFGDVDGDGSVAASDFTQFRLFFGGVNAAFDFDNDGAVAAADFTQFRLRFGGTI